MEKRKPKDKVVGKVPVNSRIEIDYTKGEKPQVNFSYPRKDFDKQLSYNTYSALIAFCITLLPASILGALAASSDEYGYMVLNEPCNITIINNNLINSSLTGYVNEINISTNFSFHKQSIVLTCDDNKTTYYDIEKYDQMFLKDYYGLDLDEWTTHNRTIYNKSDSGIINVFKSMPNAISVSLKGLKEDDIVLYLLALSIIAWFIVTPLISKIIIKQKWFIEKYPTFNRGKASRGYYASFKDVPENNILEIPIFKNIWMDYKASGDFSKYLAKVEIKEHPFNKIVKRYKRNGKKTTLTKRNITYWYARFHFLQNPKSGKLEVWFR